MSELLPPLTPDDLASFAFVSDPQLSPDGKQAAYVVRHMDVERDEYRSAIWMVPADGSSEPAQFSSGTKQDVGPRWSPDGRRQAAQPDRPLPPHR